MSQNYFSRISIRFLLRSVKVEKGILCTIPSPFIGYRFRNLALASASPAPLIFFLPFRNSNSNSFALNYANFQSRTNQRGILPTWHIPMHCFNLIDVHCSTLRAIYSVCNAQCIVLIKNKKKIHTFIQWGNVDVFFIINDIHCKWNDYFIKYIMRKKEIRK